ncbi:MAG: hypothetical protein IKU08_10800 [Clostridia bacterium]|nr:hypothetical protein [Clostridia bacterium]
MKKSTRILAILMAFVMLLGSFSVMGSAYQAYKGDAIKDQYNDVDAVEFDLEQSASMALDELDRMLAKEQMVLDVFIGTLDLSDVNTTLTSVLSLVSSVETLLPLLGDAASLPSFVTPLEGVQRYEDTDLDVVYALLNFISKLAPLVEKYVNGSVNLGILDSFIADFKFDVRELAIGLVYSMTEAGSEYDAFDEDSGPLPEKYTNTTNGAITLLQDILNELILGEWKKLDDEFDNKYSYVMYGSYAFYDENGVQETAPDTATYDYYGWVHPNQWVTTGLGGSVRVDEGDPIPAPDYSIVDITTNKTGYVFIENLMQAAYNRLLVPVLNRDTRVWLRKLCGVEYDSTYTARTVYNEVTGEWEPNLAYDPTYDGDYVYDAENIYDQFLNKDARVQTVTIPAGETFVDNFNNTLGEFLDNVLKVERGVPTAEGYVWNWEDGTVVDGRNNGNSKLFDNICSVLRFILQITQGLFFSDIVDIPSAEEMATMNNQQLVSFVLRAILNSSVDWMYIESEHQTIADVGYRAVEQLAWQDIPQYTYTKPARATYASDEAYYDAVVEKAITILFDVAVYNLNQGFDMVPASGNDPVAGEGLLQYSDDEGTYEDKLIQIVAWAVTTYGPILNLDFKCNAYDGETGDLTIDDVWMDIDTIINSLIPIKGTGAWISDKIAGDGSQIVSKTLIFDYIIKPVCYLDATNLAEIFGRNPNGQFNTANGVKIIMTILNNVFQLLFPGVFQMKDTIDEVLDNDLLGAMVGDLIKVLGTNNTTNANGAFLEAQGDELAQVALPLVCMLLGLSDDQEFEEMEINISDTIPTTGAAPTFTVINGSSGINTAYTDVNGVTHQDKLYTYKVTHIYVRTYNDAGSNTNALTASITTGEISGGEKLTVALNGTRTAGNLVEIEVNYQVFLESGESFSVNGQPITLSKTVYTYVGATNLDDDALATKTAESAPYVEYYPSIYLDSGDDLDDVEGYSIRLKDGSSGASTATVTGFNKIPEFLTKNADAAETAVSLTGEQGLYFLYPFDVATKADGTFYERFEINYEVDENGDYIVDEETGERIPDGTDNGGIVDGEYLAETNISAFGTTYTIPTTIVLYDSFGLESMFERAVSANRQASDYQGDFEGAWNGYVAALKNAARLALKPKDGSNFWAQITALSDADKALYTNLYEKYATELEAAIERLETFAANSGTAGLKTALAKYSGLNYTAVANDDGYPTRVNIEYDDPAYTYFGMRDYVPHTYNKYRGARDRVEDLIESQQAFVLGFEEGYELTDEDKAAYDESVLAYEEAVANMGVISSIEATYAIHMLNLTGSRLIRLPGDTSKLEILYDTYGDAKDSTASYTESSEERYDRAVAFAAEVLAESDPRPSKINEASSELVAAWKKLAESASYVELNAAITAAEAIIAVTGSDVDKQKDYTKDSYQAFMDAYNAALNAEKDLSDTEENNKYLADLTDDLNLAMANLAPAGSGGSSEPVVEFITEPNDNFMDFNYNQAFIPQLSVGAYNHETFYQFIPGTDIEVTGFLVGIGENTYDIKPAFATLENAEVTLEYNEYGMIGTGAYVLITNATTGDIVDAYQIVVIGDLDGDSVVSGADEPYILDNINYVFEWEFDGENGHFAAAADVGNDGAIDAGDSAYILAANGGEGYINQEVDPNYNPSYVSLI